MIKLVQEWVKHNSWLVSLGIVGGGAYTLYRLLGKAYKTGLKQAQANNQIQTDLTQ